MSKIGSNHEAICMHADEREKDVFLSDPLEAGLIYLFKS